MGIKELKVLIDKNAIKAVSKIKYNELSDKIIAIDISIYLYKFMYGGGQNFYTNFLNQIMLFKKYNIVPVYVFDGKPPDEKNHILKGRKELKRSKYERKEEIEKKILDVNNNIEKNKDNEESLTFYKDHKKILNKELNKLKLSIISIKDIDISNLKKIFDLLNIKYILADTEAEIICSYLCHSGIVNGCLSNDTDILPNNGLIFYTGFNLNNDYLIKYDLKIILQELGLIYEEFIDLCILCGCDYTIKIKNVGCITALKLIKKYKTIENIIENIKDIKKYNINDEFLTNFHYEKARVIFKNQDFNYNLELEEKKLDFEVIDIFFKENNIKFDTSKLMK